MVSRRLCGLFGQAYCANGWLTEYSGGNAAVIHALGMPGKLGLGKSHCFANSDRGELPAACHIAQRIDTRFCSLKVFIDDQISAV